MQILTNNQNQGQGLHAALQRAGIPHDYTIRPGGHSWVYWVNSLDYHLLFFTKYFKSQLKTAK